MAIKNDHRNLRSGPEPTTTRPSILGASIAGGLIEKEAERGPLPMATEHARARHSWAGACARQVAYNVAGVVPSEPANENPSALWNFAMGRTAHDIIQSALSRNWANTTARVRHEVGIDCGVRAGTADTVIEWDKPQPFAVDSKVYPVTRMVNEYKGMGGFKFKMQVKDEGPARSAYLQGAMNAVGVDADMLVLGSMAFDQMSPTVARQTFGPDFEAHDRFWAEWWFPREVYETDAHIEAARLERIVYLVDKSGPASVPRHVPGEMPEMGRIVDPSSGKWVERGPGEPYPITGDDSREGEIAYEPGDIINAGAFWGCNYCPFQSHCVAEKAAGR